MRLARLLILASLSLSAGCAALIAGVGKDLTGLKTRDEVHAALGPPATAGLADGTPFEEYRTRRKIVEGWNRYDEGYAMMLMMTCGAVDLICVPHELYLLGRRTLLGQTIRVTYDAAGTVTGMTLDGASLYWLGLCPHGDPRITGQ